MEYIRRILVVDDEPNYANTLVRHLKREGFSADLARDGQRASIKIEEACSKKTVFDLVIMNPLIQAGNGIDLLGWVHQNHPLISVILVSAYGYSDETIGRIRPAIDDYDKKPLTPQRMMELIDSVERKRKCSFVRMRKQMDNCREELSDSHPVAKDSSQGACKQ